jgi:hypothetical protein
MSNLGDLNFDASAVEPRASFEAIPAGVYDVVVVNSEKKTTKAGTGAFVELEMQILNGPYQNRKLWDRLNLWNPNDKAVAIARGTLSAICRAVGVLAPKDTAELHGKPLSCTVVVKKDDDGNPTNEVKGYKPRGGGQQARVPQANPAQPVTQQTVATGGNESAPWAQ